LILLVAAFLMLVQYVPGGFTEGGGVGIRVIPNPAKISPGQYSMMEIELKNVNNDKDLTVVLTAATYDKNVFFDESYTQSYGSASINIGPQETRKMSLKVKTKPDTMQGKYTVDFKAKPAGEDKGAETRVFLAVDKS